MSLGSQSWSEPPGERCWFYGLCCPSHSTPILVQYMTVSYDCIMQIRPRLSVALFSRHSINIDVISFPTNTSLATSILEHIGLLLPHAIRLVSSWMEAPSKTLPFFPEEFHDVSLFCKVNLPTLTLPFFLQNFMTSLYFALQP